MKRKLGWIALKVLAIATFVAATNDGAFDRVNLLLAQSRIFTMVFFLGVWGLCLTCLLIAAFQPRLRWRIFWAASIAVTTFAGYAYMRISHSQLTVFDIASLWSSKADTGRALSFYADQAAIALAVAAFGFLAMVSKPPGLAPLVERALARLNFAPVLPVLVIMGIVFWKSGGGTHALPQQFGPAAMGVIVAAKTLVEDLPERADLKQHPVKAPLARHIVLIVDESVRGDYLNLKTGNAETPLLAELSRYFVNFGNAASGNNCSHYSNAILRLGGGRNNLIKTVTTSPSLWQYARNAGFKTVFIDAAASHIKNTGALQNFMTAKEKAEIDEYIVVENVAAPYLDFELSRLIGEIQARPEPHFIYANKNGPHFPYDDSYPKNRAVFTPTMSGSAGGSEIERKVNSYSNAIRWAVDGFFQDLLGRVDLTRTAILYTADHGQNLDIGKVTHCTTVNPDPREGLVPMMFISADPGLKAMFEAGAKLNYGRTTHFALFPTLLELFGYPRRLLGRDYGPSLLERIGQAPKFTSGDIFGTFSKQVRWTALDTDLDYRENGAGKSRSQALRQTGTGPAAN